jgi:prepilin-type N-terminal cleavage/methylation domain-containing protein
MRFASPRVMRRGFTLIELLVVIAIVAILAAMLFPVFAQAKASAKSVKCVSNSHQIGLASLTYLADHDDTYAMSRLPDPMRGIAGTCAQPDWRGSRFNWRHSVHPYSRNTELHACPTNERAWTVTTDSLGNKTLGDEANAAYPEGERLPVSYAYGGYFHETWFACANGGAYPRPRNGTEISDPAGLILLTETNLATPDAGHWTLGNATQIGVDVFHTHTGKTITWTLADGHTKGMRLARTVGPRQMWTDNPANQAYIETLFNNGAGKSKRY